METIRKGIKRMGERKKGSLEEGRWCGGGEKNNGEEKKRERG
jgi:hypothetical protein